MATPRRAWTTAVQLIRGRPSFRNLGCPPSRYSSPGTSSHPQEFPLLPLARRQDLVAPPPHRPGVPRLEPVIGGLPQTGAVLLGVGLGQCVEVGGERLVQFGEDLMVGDQQAHGCQDVGVEDHRVVVAGVPGDPGGLGRIGEESLPGPLQFLVRRLGRGEGEHVVPAAQMVVVPARVVHVGAVGDALGEPGPHHREHVLLVQAPGDHAVPQQPAHGSVLDALHHLFDEIAHEGLVAAGQFLGGDVRVLLDGVGQQGEVEGQSPGLVRGDAHQAPVGVTR
ncbi:hypothetical protein AB5J72_05485 [Streptomyces sp. CG1]|uniref:hypothetical protein n=1 Tax=Streptomyces sp. CG1 TaxID=1287523 RepID=UPI0034E2452F